MFFCPNPHRFSKLLDGKDGSNRGSIGAALGAKVSSMIFHPDGKLARLSAKVGKLSFNATAAVLASSLRPAAPKEIPSDRPLQAARIFGTRSPFYKRLKAKLTSLRTLYEELEFFGWQEAMDQKESALDGKDGTSSTAETAVDTTRSSSSSFQVLSFRNFVRFYSFVFSHSHSFSNKDDSDSGTNLADAAAAAATTVSGIAPPSSHHELTPTPAATAMLVPYADLINHSPDASPNVAVGGDKGAFEIRSGESGVTESKSENLLDANELFVSYASKKAALSIGSTYGSAHFFQQFGFLDPQLGVSFDLELALRPEHALYEMKRKTFPKHLVDMKDKFLRDLNFLATMDEKDNAASGSGIFSAVSSAFSIVGNGINVGFEAVVSVLEFVFGVLKIVVYDCALKPVGYVFANTFLPPAEDFVNSRPDSPVELSLYNEISHDKAESDLFSAHRAVSLSSESANEIELFGAGDAKAHGLQNTAEEGSQETEERAKYLAEKQKLVDRYFNSKPNARKHYKFTDMIEYPHYVLYECPLEEDTNADLESAKASSRTTKKYRAQSAKKYHNELLPFARYLVLESESAVR